MRRTVTIGLSIAFALGAALVAAAQESPDPTGSPSAGEQELRDLEQRFRERCRQDREACARLRRDRRAHKGFRFLHADGVGMNREGETVDVRMQKGIIEQVDGDSITLKSADGFTSTYAIDDQTFVRERKREAAVSDLEEGEMARVVAVKEDGGWVARRINCVGEPGPRFEAERAA